MLTRAIFRSLCALLIGFLLVSNPAEMTVLLIQIIGGLFTFSGIIAFIGYFTNRIRQSGFRPVFPIVGIGSLAFGVCLLVWPDQFVDIFMYVLGTILCLIGISQMINLVNYRKFAPLTWSLFVMPLLITAAGVVVLAFPMETASIPFIILGATFIFYGVGEFLLGIRFWRYRRIYDAALAEQELQAQTVTDAEAVEIVEDAQE